MITSNTIVRNGMPFVPLVIRQVLPYVDQCIITISEKSDDGTNGALCALAEEYPSIEIDYENVTDVGDLTAVRQDQVDRSDGEWILFLDDDDFWPHEDLEGCLNLLTNGIDGLAIKPYQLLDATHHDYLWWRNNGRCFTKFFRNDGINYKGAWPKDLIFSHNRPLFWKKNPLVKRVPYHFFHLAALKPDSFRSRLTSFSYREPLPKKLERELPRELLGILNHGTHH